MCATVNEPGVQYTCVAERRRGNAFTPVSPAASEALERISEALVARTQAEKRGETFAVSTRMVRDCVHKVEAVAHRLMCLRAHKARLLGEVRSRLTDGGCWGTAAFLEPEIVFEFEALVLQARAALDTVAWFLSGACGQRSWRFSKLRNVLSARAPSDKRVQRCLALLDECAWMASSKVLIGDPSTRSYVAHYGSLLTSQQTCFTVDRVEPDRALLFDMEMSGNVPVMATAGKIHEEVLFFVTAAVSAFLGLPLPEREAFASDLGREFVVLSEVIVPPGQGTKVGVVKEMRPGGVTVGDVSVSTDVLGRAVTLSKLGMDPAEG